MLTTHTVKNIALAFALAGFMTACSVAAGRESSGQYVDDSTITSKVKSKIVADESLKGFEIHVETFQGTVQLSGFVDSNYSKNKAEQIANNVNGVRSVQDDLVVR